MDLPTGTKLIPLQMHRDQRGIFTEIFRSEWDPGIRPVQWNLVTSRTGTLRGVHVHAVHDDYLIVIQGKALIGLKDLRRASPTEGKTTLVPLDGEALQAIVIPHGVAHGFYFQTPAVHLYAVSHYWDTDDELGCRWDDPELGILWPEIPAYLSERDKNACSYRELLKTLERRQPIKA